MYIAIMGYGVVGSGVAEVINKNHDSIVRKSTQSELEIKYILDLKDFPGDPNEKLFIKDFNIILNDPEVKVVVETMGGLHPAYEFVSACLKAGKSVVTSNKELVAAKGCELLGYAAEHNVNFLFEASVGGVIPIIRPISQCLAANEINEFAGILNGTTNYIMDAMHHSDVDFADILAQAQALGYAEADPSADIDGLDIQRKLILSANVAFGVSLREADVPVFGIRNVRKADIARFQAHDCTCKLIATAEQRGGSISAYVEPTLLGSDALEAAVPANFNLISMEGDRMGVQSFFGQGAGRYPTAYNVVQDLVDITRGVHAFYTDSFVPAVPDNAGVQHRYYVRTRAALPELAALAEGDWEGAVITQPVPVSRMHALMAQALAQDGESFFAALQ